VVRGRRVLVQPLPQSLPSLPVPKRAVCVGCGGHTHLLDPSRFSSPRVMEQVRELAPPTCDAMRCDARTKRHEKRASVLSDNIHTKSIRAMLGWLTGWLACWLKQRCAAIFAEARQPDYSSSHVATATCVLTNSNASTSTRPTHLLVPTYRIPRRRRHPLPALAQRRGEKVAATAAAAAVIAAYILCGIGSGQEIAGSNSRHAPVFVMYKFKCKFKCTHHSSSAHTPLPNDRITSPEEENTTNSLACIYVHTRASTLPFLRALTTHALSHSVHV
jgi:hypothetical protein